MMKVFNLLIVVAFLQLVLIVHANDTDADPLCFNIYLFSNFTLAQCNELYTQYSSGESGSAGNFCNGICPRALAQIYQDCGYTTSANQIATECAQDSMRRYCGDMIRDEEFNRDVQTMITTCDGTSDCSGECQTAIQNIGCCATIVPNITETGVPIDQCNLEGCTPIPIYKPSVSPQICFNSAIQEDSTSQQCYQDFISAAAMAMGNPEPTREFCSGNTCPQTVARTYAMCGLSAHSTLVQKGCALDETDRYCGNVVDRLITPQWTEMVEAATRSCEGTDCTNSTCKAAIDNLGCCIALGVEVGGAQLPLAQCNIEYCPATFELTDGSGATVIKALPFMFVLMLALVHLALV